MDKNIEAMRAARAALDIATTPLAEDRQRVLRAVSLLDDAIAQSQQVQDDRRDAERFRWIEENCTDKGGGHGFTVFVPVDHEDIGCGIDAAIAQEKE